MTDLPERLQQWVDLLEATPDRADRMQLLIDIADRFQAVPSSVASRPYPRDRLTPACESEVYVWAEPDPAGGLQFYFAVENPQGISARALAVILDESLSGAPPEQVARVPGDVVFRLFGSELSMGKSMGLIGMVSMVQHYARSFAERLPTEVPAS